jgi:hypothetical protein
MARKAVWNRMRESFRVAEVGDAENLPRLVNSAYRGDASRRGWTTEADLPGEAPILSRAARLENLMEDVRPRSGRAFFQR